MVEIFFEYGPQLMIGLRTTLFVAGGSFVCGLLLATILAPLGLYGAKHVRRTVSAYVGLIRGLPELLIIFLVFYGGTVMLTNIVGRYIEMEPLIAGILSLTVVSAAFFTEILRAALQSVPIGQWEAALALGLRRPQSFRLVLLPQMAAKALPGIGNQWLVILKDSALISVIGLEDLMRKSVVAAGATHEPLAFYLAAAALYIAITGLSVAAFGAFGAQFSPQQSR